MDKKNFLGNSNVITGILVVALVVAAFFVGMLWMKVQNLEGGSRTGTGTGTAGGGAPVAARSISEIAEEAGLDGDAIEECAQSDEMATKVQNQYQSGIRAGVTGTPGNILLDTQANKARLVSGAVPLQTLKEELTELEGENGTTSYGAPVEIDNLEPLSDGDHVRGNQNARFALIEYSDFECPFCQRFHPTASQLIADMDNVKWVYRHFPLDSIHPQARELAKASECAAKEGGEEAFWKFADTVYQ